MSKRSRRNGTGAVAGISFWTFIVIKVWGTSLATWSWWWILLPCIPVWALILQKLGLMSWT